MNSESIKRDLFRYFQTHGLEGYDIGNLLKDGLQRYWEYAWCLDNLPIEKPEFATILDVGCDPACLFPLMLAKQFKEVWANDIPPCSVSLPANVQYFDGPIQEVQFGGRYLHFVKRMEIDAVVCISVLEHVEDKESFCRALDSIPAPILLTCEFSRDDAHIADQLVTLDVLTTCLGYFEHHYLSKMEACPVFALNSQNGEWRPLALLLLPN